MQDYWFVLEFTRLANWTLAIAPTEHLDVLLSGLSALKDELNWFQDKAMERQLDLNVPRQVTCQTEKPTDEKQTEVVFVRIASLEKAFW